MNIIAPIRARHTAPTFEEWAARGLAKARDSGTDALWWGGWWNEGRKWDRDRVALIAAPDWFGPDLKTIRNYARVQKKFKLSRARDILPMRSLEALCGLPLDQAEALAEEGWKRGWKSYDFRWAAKRLRDSQVVPRAPGFTLEQLVADGYKAGTIYADVPWPFDHPIIQAKVAEHYQSMSMDELCKLPIQELARADCHLHMWVPMTHLEEAFDLMRAWGFRYAKSGLVWCKSG